MNNYEKLKQMNEHIASLKSDVKTLEVAIKQAERDRDKFIQGAEFGVSGIRFLFTPSGGMEIKRGYAYNKSDEAAFEITPHNMTAFLKQLHEAFVENPKLVEKEAKTKEEAPEGERSDAPFSMIDLDDDAKNPSPVKE